MHRIESSCRLVVVLLFSITLSACSQDSSPEPKDQAAVPVQAATVSEDLPAPMSEADSPEVIVFGGIDDVETWLEAENWWSDGVEDGPVSAPHVLITGIGPQWQENAQKIPVSDKKQAFYRFMLPLVLHANEMVETRRKALLRARDEVKAGEKLSAEELEQLKKAMVLLRVGSEEEAGALTADSPEMPRILDDLIYRLDVIPPGLALGQAAYESGWGTSRFAVQGNSLFGQWTFGGDGIAPEQKRKHLGNYGIAAFEWPFDSVRGYFINLMSHPAYEDLRKVRAELRAAGKPISSLALADGLLRYSERGQEYVDDLKGIIRVNDFDKADNAVFRDEPVRFLVMRATPEEAEETRRKIDEMRANGQIEEIVERMRLD
ncbi:MAG: glucosaminidase domain-containing protein [Lysobacterales bacterium]|jgi:uncharacterized FlgJ-related protein